MGKHILVGIDGSPASMDVVKYLQARDLDWAINIAKRLGIKQVFGQSGGSRPPMKEETQRYLESLYSEDIIELESLLEMDLGCWK